MYKTFKKSFVRYEYAHYCEKYHHFDLNIFQSSCDLYQLSNI